jgi:hypothetical protein
MRLARNCCVISRNLSAFAVFNSSNCQLNQHATVGNRFALPRGMCDVCKSSCEYGLDLNGAAAGLARASKLLADSIALRDPAELIEVYFALVKTTKARTAGALAAYRDHLQKNAKDSRCAAEG